ncbi:MAG: glycosyltransferase 87 family protein [Nocardioidaceae bacterium]
MAGTPEHARLGAALPVVVPLLGILAVLLAPTGLLAALGAVGSGDFQWSGAHLLFHGVDPYHVQLTGPGGRIILEQNPNYLPGLYVVLLPLGALPFAVARCAWAALNVLMCLASAVWLGRAVGLRGWGLAGLPALLACSAPFVMALYTGQQTSLVLFSSVLAYRSRSQVTQGLTLALAVTKYSFSPLALLLLARRRWWALVVLALVSLASVGVLSAWTRRNPVTVALEPLRVGRGMHRGATDAMSLSGMLLDAPRSPATYVVGLGTALLLFAVSRRVLALGDWVDALACASLISLMVFPHVIYDLCLLLPVLASALRLRGRGQAVVLVVVGYFWFNSVLGGFPLGPYSLGGVATNLLLLGAALASLVHAVHAPEGTDAQAPVARLQEPSAP